MPHTFLLGHINKAAGQFGKGGRTEARKAIELDRDFAFGYFNLAVNDIYLDRLEKPRTHCSARRDVGWKWQPHLRVPELRVVVGQHPRASLLEQRLQTTASFHSLLFGPFSATVFRISWCSTKDQDEDQRS
ncbi:MAG: hypothetical protein WB781_16285, partial [Candidatus Sulfotelmatobacter sp.]